LDVARRLGADRLVNAARGNAVEAVRELTGGGAEYVVEAGGGGATRRGAGASGGQGGRNRGPRGAGDEPALPLTAMGRDEQAASTSFAYAARDFEASLGMIEPRRFDLKPWTETRTLEEGQAAFAKMAHTPGATLKLMLTV